MNLDYTQMLAAHEEAKHLISMVPVERILALGSDLGLNESSRVLDLCCGYGTMLKLWSEAFGIGGVGVDRVKDFIKTGKSRLTDKRVELVCGDVLKYRDKEKYDIVVCTELSTDVFASFAEGVAFLEKFLKPGGTLVFGRLYAKVPDPPQALIDFDGPLPTLTEIYEECRQCGWLITAMASSTDAQWEQYIFRGAQQYLEALRKDPNDAWTDKWFRMYFDHRRTCEGWALFAIERI